MEHRWGNRVPVDLEVQIFAHPASTAWGRLRDISVSGGFIETGLKIPTLSTVCITTLARNNAAPRRASAIVVRVDADGVGVEWFDSDADVIATLMQETTPYRASALFVDDMRL